MSLRACDLSAVAFDLDDTLFDRTAAVVLLLNDWLGELSPSATAEILTRDACGHSPRKPFFHWLAENFPRLGQASDPDGSRAECPDHRWRGHSARRLSSAGLSGFPPGSECLKLGHPDPCGKEEVHGCSFGKSSDPNGSRAECLDHRWRGPSARRLASAGLGDFTPGSGCQTLGCSGAELWARFRVELPQWLVPDPAAAPLLTQLADAGLRTGVLTDGHSVGQRAKLQALGLAPRFAPERVLVTSELAAEKPDARAFGALVAALGVPAARILFVGDHPEKDIAGAKHSGLKACWLRRRPGCGCVSADLVIDSLGDLFPQLWPPQ